MKKFRISVKHRVVRYFEYEAKDAASAMDKFDKDFEDGVYDNEVDYWESSEEFDEVFEVPNEKEDK